MPRLLFTPVAATDLLELSHSATSATVPHTAQRVALDVIARCEHVAASRNRMGLERPELLPGLRSIPYGPVVIFFRYVGDVLEVVNIRSGQSDIVAYFKTPAKPVGP